MFFDIAWPEFMLIGIVALVVIGPKDLPRAMRVAGFWLRKARTMSREFQSSIDQMIREAELDEVRDELKSATDFDIAGEFHRSIDADGSLAESIKASTYPDYFVEAEGPPAPVAQPVLPPPDAAAPEVPLPPGMATPEFVGYADDAPREFVGFEEEEPAHEGAAPASRAPEPAGS
jgi:sec-independent protein translocase protein TatB